MSENNIPIQCSNLTVKFNLLASGILSKNNRMERGQTDIKTTAMDSIIGIIKTGWTESEEFHSNIIVNSTW